MPYRIAAGEVPRDAAVGCVRCGGLTSLALRSTRDGNFTCHKCHQNQAALRDRDDAAPEAITLKGHDVGSYEALTPFAREFGQEIKTSGLELVCDGLATKAGISVNSGTVMGCDHHIATPGLPKMRFVTELPSHVEAKQRGTIKEVQTGDAEFDDEVYIESDASDAAVGIVLSAPAVRRAIRELLREASAVVVNEFGVSVYVPREQAPFEPRGLRRRLVALRVLAGAC